MTQDRPVLGILLMLGFCVLAPFGDAIAKLLGERVPLGFTVFLRFAVQAAILAPLVWWGSRKWQMTRRVFGIVVLRTILHIFGIGLMFTALQFLELADAVAIIFVMPFILLALGRVFLDEEVGVRRLSAAAVGFVGTMMVVQPSFAEVGWPALLPLGVAVNFAAFILLTRLVAKETDPIGMQAVSGGMATVMLLPVLIWGPSSGFGALAAASPDMIGWVLLLAIGTVGSVSHLLIVWSLRYAPAATLAPMQYLEIPVAVIFGWLFWQDLPNGLAVFGICITCAAGLYVIRREQAIARARLAKPVTAHGVPLAAE
jgi:drug/metabolite transporter (DMT)-like permease